MTGGFLVRWAKGQSCIFDSITGINILYCGVMFDRMVPGNELGGVFLGEEDDGGFEFGAAIPGSELLGERVER